MTIYKSKVNNTLLFYSYCENCSMYNKIGNLTESNENELRDHIKNNYYTIFSNYYDCSHCYETTIVYTAVFRKIIFGNMTILKNHRYMDEKSYNCFNICRYNNEHLESKKYFVINHMYIGEKFSYENILNEIKPGTILELDQYTNIITNTTHNTIFDDLCKAAQDITCFLKEIHTFKTINGTGTLQIYEVTSYPSTKSAIKTQNI